MNTLGKRVLLCATSLVIGLTSSQSLIDSLKIELDDLASDTARIDILIDQIWSNARTNLELSLDLLYEKYQLRLVETGVHS